MRSVHTPAPGWCTQPASPQAYFNHAATEIQRRWRGYWSRAHVHSFTARRAYLAAFAAQNAAVRRKMGDAYRAELARRAGGRKETALERFEAQAARLHHLVSTAAVPGVFGAPLEAAAGLAPLVEGLTIEEHLQRACKAQVGSASEQRHATRVALPWRIDEAAHVPGAIDSKHLLSVHDCVLAGGASAAAAAERGGSKPRKVCSGGRRRKRRRGCGHAPRGWPGRRRAAGWRRRGLAFLGC